MSKEAPAAVLPAAAELSASSKEIEFRVARNGPDFIASFFVFDFR